MFERGRAEYFKATEHLALQVLTGSEWVPWFPSILKQGLIPGPTLWQLHKNGASDYRQIKVLHAHLLCHAPDCYALH
jgi:hypothetical protein